LLTRRVAELERLLRADSANYSRPPSSPVLYADETCGRAGGALAYVHVACIEYLTVMHVGGRSAADIDAGGVLTEFTGTLMRDGYTGYAHLPAIHAWCAVHLLRDLRAVSDADPATQIWALAMADTLLDANQAAHHVRAADADHLDADVLNQIRNHYHGAIAKGAADNHDQSGALADNARTLGAVRSKSRMCGRNTASSKVAARPRTPPDPPVHPLRRHDPPLRSVGWWHAGVSCWGWLRGGRSDGAGA
jgi:hypothetical protein